MRHEITLMLAGWLTLAALAAAAPAALGAPSQQRGQTPPGPAQGRGRGAGAEFAGPPQGPNDVPIVEVIGCLTQGSGNAWTVTSATEPAKAPIGFSKPEELKAADAKPLGTLKFRLLGLAEFAPADHVGHRVVVRGLLIKDAGDPRLNVTSLMTASAACK